MEQQLEFVFCMEDWDKLVILFNVLYRLGLRCNIELGAGYSYTWTKVE